SEDEEEEEEEVREEQPLIYRGHGSTYGALYSARDNTDSELSHVNAYEDRANPVSLLFFLWVWPLLRRGAVGGLESTTDLPPLPKTLQTSLIREKFRKVLVRRGSVATASTNVDVNVSVSGQQGTEGWSTGGASFLDSEVAMRSIARTTPLPSTTPPLTSTDSSTDYTGPGPSVDGAKFRKTGSQTDGRTAKQSTSLLFLFSAANRAFGWHYYPLGLIKFTTDLLGFAGPLLLYQLVSFIENKQEPMYYGYLFALGLMCSTLVTAILTSHFNYQVNKVGLKVRAALITEVYRKSLSISLSTMSRYSTGQVVNFMSTDTDRIVNFCQSFHQFWSLPFQIAISLYLLYQQVGLAFLAGVAFCILLIPVNRWLAVKIGQLSTRMMADKDNRVKVISEVLTGIRVIKFYAWEKHFSSKIFELRGRELKSLKGRKYLDALCVYFWATTPVLISILTFTTYVALGNHLTAAKVFTSVALFNVLISPLNAFPWVINGLMEAWVSVKRVQLFLQLEEIDWARYYCLDYGHYGGHRADSVKSNAAAAAMCINDASFSWRNSAGEEEEGGSGENRESGEDGEERRVKRTWTLTKVNLTVPRGKLVGVTGRVGSGKSSLLAAITAEMIRLQGQVFIDNLVDGFGLVTQEAWIQQATVKSNILFGREMKPAFYLQVVNACALQEDLRILPAGDETEVGENGVTLSGGQKTRLSLARAVYQDKSVYLLDDPLAAVDAYVARHLYTHCIMGLMGHKTRILCTHHHSPNMLVLSPNMLV
ncbi:Multidrug resistance-associated protein 7, partial [Geodia barretti]